MKHYKCLLPIGELEAPAQKCTGTVFSQLSGPNSPELCLEEESEKVGLKLNIQKTKTMASGPITSWEMDGETVKTVSDFIFWGSKITADGDCNHEIKSCVLFGRKVMINLDSILKNRKKKKPKQIYYFAN